MMQGYDVEKAVAYMLPRLDTSEFKPLAGRTQELLHAAIEADMAFMHATGVLNEEGLMGDAYYDDDEAFECLLDALTAKLGVKKNEAQALASFLNQYMDLQEDFMNESGMVEWD